MYQWHYVFTSLSVCTGLRVLGKGAVKGHSLRCPIRTRRHSPCFMVVALHDDREPAPPSQGDSGNGIVPTFAKLQKGPASDSHSVTLTSFAVETGQKSHDENSKLKASVSRWKRHAMSMDHGWWSTFFGRTLPKSVPVWSANQCFKHSEMQKVKSSQACPKWGEKQRNISAFDGQWDVEKFYLMKNGSWESPSVRQPCMKHWRWTVLNALNKDWLMQAKKDGNPKCAPFQELETQLIHQAVRLLFVTLWWWDERFNVKMHSHSQETKGCWTSSSHRQVKTLIQCLDWLPRTELVVNDDSKKKNIL